MGNIRYMERKVRGNPKSGPLPQATSGAEWSKMAGPLKLPMKETFTWFISLGPPSPSSFIFYYKKQLSSWCDVSNVKPNIHIRYYTWTPRHYLPPNHNLPSHTPCPPLWKCIDSCFRHDHRFIIFKYFDRYYSKF